MRMPFALVLILAATAAVGGDLAAATAQDIIGTWVIDADETWTRWKDLPEMERVPEELRAKVKAAAFKKMEAATLEITAEAMTRIDGELKETAAYSIAAIEGDVLTITNIGADGKPSDGRIEIQNGKLIISAVEAKADKSDKGGAKDGKETAKPKSQPVVVYKPKKDA